MTYNEALGHYFLQFFINYREIRCDWLPGLAWRAGSGSLLSNNAIWLHPGFVPFVAVPTCSPASLKTHVRWAAMIYNNVNQINK